MTHSHPIGFVDANGLRFGYLEWGPRQGAPLVLMVHGFPDTPHTWAQLAPAIAAKGFRVVAPFTRGYAPSGMPTRDATTRDLGEDVVALISALGAERAHLVGHDWGAEAVYAAVGLAPQKVITLTAIGIPHRAALTPTPKLAWALRHFFTLNLPGAERRFARDDFAQLELLVRRWSPTWRLTAADLEPIKECFRAPGTAHGALGYYRATSALTPSFMKARIAVPTLNVAGADDPGVGPETYEATRKHYTGEFEVAVIPGGHFCHREAPDQFIERMARFLARHALETLVRRLLQRSASLARRVESGRAHLSHGHRRYKRHPRHLLHHRSHSGIRRGRRERYRRGLLSPRADEGVPSSGLAPWV